MNIKAKIKDLIKTFLPRKKGDITETRNPKLIKEIQSQSLLFYYGNHYSQLGQDGIINEIFRRLKIQQGTFVEFGAWDGIFFSNCRWLVEKGWSGVFIEGNPESFKILQQNYISNQNIKCLNRFVESTGNNSIDSLLKEVKVDAGLLDFMSIDIDGRDLEIFEHMKATPKVILIEGGYSWSPFLDRKLEPDIAANNLQQPLPIIFQLAQSKGYTPVCFHQDSYLIRNDLAFHFEGINNDAVTLYREGFYFMTDKHRKDLIKSRQTIPSIKSIENQFNVPFIELPKK